MIPILNHPNKIFFCGFIFILSTVYCVSVEPIPGNSLSISLKNFNKSTINGQAFFKYVELHSSDPVIIHIENVPVDIAFIIVQAHVQGWNITMSMFNVTNEITFSGSNVGFKLDSAIIDQNNISIINNHNSTITALVAVVAYIQEAPIPGGHDEKLFMNTIPFQKITTTNSLLIIEAEPASAPFIGHQLRCNKLNPITYGIYRLHASSYDFTNKTYFSAILKMLTVDDIIKNSEKIPQSISSSPIKMIYSAYLGVGSAYAMIATCGNHSAAYVPTFSYGCDPVFNKESCYFLNLTIAKVLCAVVFCSGVLIIFLGKKFLYGPMIIISLFIGSIIGFIVFNIFEINDINWIFGGSILVGVIGSLVVATVSYFMPCTAFLPMPLSVGFLIASVTYFGMSDGVSVFKNDSSFWPIYGSIVLLVLLLFNFCFPKQNTLSGDILGSSGIILSIDYWAGSNLKYIVVNTIRRLVVKDFNSAIISPPIQNADIWLCVLWIVLILFSIYYKPTSYIIIKSTGLLPKVSAPRGYRRVIPLRKTDEVYRF